MRARGGLENNVSSDDDKPQQQTLFQFNTQFKFFIQMCHNLFKVIFKKQKQKIQQQQIIYLKTK